MDAMADVNLSYLLDAVVHAGLGVAAFGFSLWLFGKAAPMAVEREVVREKNVAAGIVAAAVILSLGIIIAASFH